MVGQGELWVVNTRFGCLCTLDAAHSFTPRWRPPFVSALAPEDRCHLNGLGMVAGRPKCVTALGETDTAGGWRANKATGGLLLDIDDHKILLRGLSMPHSPRWYQGRLWLLESGQGSLAEVDLAQRSWRTTAQLPGFTRGLDFCGPLAFIGLSQVRETAVFSGIPLVQRLKERTCGVWVVHTEQGAGDVVQFARFLPPAAERCGRLLVAGPQDLHSLLATLPGIGALREAGAIGVQEFDRYLPLLSLPRVLGITRDNVPADVPYLDPEVLRRRKGGHVPELAGALGRKVGLVWGGSPTHRDDRHRSCRLHDWLPFLRTRGVCFYSLQKDERRGELAGLPPEARVQDLSVHLDDLGDLAWLMLELDLVITVDTSAAHVAGALGQPVWTLLSYVPDWRWGLTGEQTPWYPTMRLFRQPQPGDWGSVVESVTQALAHWAAG